MIVLKDHRLTVARKQYHQMLAAPSAGKPGGNQATCACLGVEKALCAALTSTLPTGGNSAQNISRWATLNQPQPLTRGGSDPDTCPLTKSQFSLFSTGQPGEASFRKSATDFSWVFQLPQPKPSQLSVDCGGCFSLTASQGLKERVSYQLMCCEFAAPWMILTGISLVPVKLPADRKGKQLCALFPSCTQTWYLHPGNNDLKRTSKTGIICHLEGL